MRSPVAERMDLQQRLQAVPRPRPVLARERERRLTERQREVLDRLGELFDAGFADLTMAEIAAWVGCSLRTLYGVAPSRDELVLVVVDRNLWRVGRSAREAIAPGMSALEALRAYLRAATVAVSRTTGAFARDLARMPAAQQLRDAHSEYLVAVTRQLLDLAVEDGQIADVDTGALARVMAGLGGDLARPEVIPTLRTSPKDAADAVLDIILRGLPAPDSEER
jgi:AcrR family transcriptional regulator